MKVLQRKALPLALGMKVTESMLDEDEVEVRARTLAEVDRPVPTVLDVPLLAERAASLAETTLRWTIFCGKDLHL